MDPLVLISVGISIILAGIQVRKFLKERKDQLHQEAASVMKAPAEKADIIIGGAVKTVEMLEKALSRAVADYEKQQLTNESLKVKIEKLEVDNQLKDHTIREQGAKIRQLEYRLAAVERGQGEHNDAS